ncbi:MAG: mechanosensitive ion channel family protein [Myxococcales bacterium]|nr:mechanosensitive ion channel family protein [Myxococcales bacterium]
MITLRDWFLGHGWTEGWAVTGAIVVALVAAVLFGELARAVGPALANKIARPTKRAWVAAFEKRRIFRSAAWILSIIVTDSLITPLLESWPKVSKLAETVLEGALVIAVTVLLSKLIAAVVDTLESQDATNQRLPVKALGQALQLTLWTYATVVFLSAMTHRDVTTLLTGLTAIGAVLVYVFRDPILGWTAGVQIAANDLVRIGDWIIVPERDADGQVAEIGLTTIKVNNWDKTISSIPTYTLVSEGFRNFRFMQESGGRRIRRSFSIDARSLRVCDDALLGRLKKNGLLEPGVEARDLRPTNLTCFRTWLEGRLKENPEIRDDMMQLVRLLPQDGRGIPVEIYAFSRGTGLVDYEHVQADIFDRVLAVLPEFDLRLFQEPTGDDLRELRPPEGG